MSGPLYRGPQVQIPVAQQGGHVGVGDSSTPQTEVGRLSSVRWFQGEQGVQSQVRHLGAHQEETNVNVEIPVVDLLRGGMVGGRNCLISGHPLRQHEGEGKTGEGQEAC